MQIRIAIVIWWIGLLLAIGALIGSAFSGVGLYQDQKAYRVCKEVAAEYERNRATEQARAASQSQADVSSTTEEDRAERMDRAFGAWIKAHGNDPPPHTCTAPPNDLWVPLAFGGPAMLLCFALSFILGGRFWLPPHKP